MNENVPTTRDPLVEINSRTVGHHWAELGLTIVGQLSETQDSWRALRAEDHLP